MGQTIEKSYTYIVPEPKQLFQCFQEKFSKASLPDWNGSSKSWTHLVLGIFREMGKSFGYNSGMEYLQLDQTWDIRLPDISTIVLALESENTDRVEDILYDELEKLMDVKAFLKVLIFYPVAPIKMQAETENNNPQGASCYREIQEHIRSSKFKLPDERYIIITPVYIQGSSIIEVSACSFDSDGKGEDLGSFQVKYPLLQSEQENILERN